MYDTILSHELEAMFQMLDINSAILLHLYVKTVKYIFLNNIYNNQIFRNCIVIVTSHKSFRLNK